jgi:hypothetical protein
VNGARSGGQGGGAAFPVADLRLHLHGRWRLARRLLDRRRRLVGAASGTVLFTEDGSDLLCREEGSLRFGRHAGPFTRAYRYAELGAGRAEVRFPDGRPFHPLDLTTGIWVAEHRCGPDLYRGLFRVLGPDLWTLRWELSGPAVDQALLTLLWREAAGIG